ncbi:MAG: tail fiber domain-containing protein, partial [Patescibacteria group bacterium]
IITRFESAWDEVQQRYVTVAEDSFDYEGPVARCDLGGGGSSTTTTNVPPKTATELAVDEITLRRLQRQEEVDIKTQPIVDAYITDYQARQKALIDAGMTPEMVAKNEVTNIQRAQRLGDISEELANLQLKAIKDAGKPTPEQIASIDAATGAAQKTGEADIERFRTATLRQINEEVASASGLRPTDTPILRLSERAGEESARQQGMLTSRLAETNATARLNFPLASAKLTSDIATSQQSLSEAANQFSQQLQMRAQDNRMRLFAGNQAPQVSSVGFGASMANERFRGASTTTDTEKSLSLGDIGSFAGGIGGVMRAGSMFRSDRRLKRDVVRVGELMPGVGWYSYHYSWDAEDAALRYGVMADELERVLPEAVLYDTDGFARVDYG